MIDTMKKKKEEVAKRLVSSWPFQQKGLPFYLWLHNIMPDKIQKALNAWTPLSAARNKYA
jgi:hypothetical protein